MSQEGNISSLNAPGRGLVDMLGKEINVYGNQIMKNKGGGTNNERDVFTKVIDAEIQTEMATPLQALDLRGIYGQQITFDKGINYEGDQVELLGKEVNACGHQIMRNKIGGTNNERDASTKTTDAESQPNTATFHQAHVLCGISGQQTSLIMRELIMRGTR
jgi:hypothetical protein